jgi:hypothetical protein
MKLDEFLRISGRQLLDHAGKVSAEEARAKAEQEYAKYRQRPGSQRNQRSNFIVAEPIIGCSKGS